MTQKPTLTVLLGAGFSQGVGLPGTDDLTNGIIARAEPRDVSRAMWQGLREFAPASNFETMFHAIEALYSLKETRPGSTTQAVANAFAELRPRWLKISSDDLLRFYQSSLRVLHSMLAESVDVIRHASPLSLERTVTMLRRVVESYEPRVFDLNYDEVGDEIAGNVRDGFPRNDVACRFDYKDLSAEDGRIEWCHLHGSVNYQMVPPGPHDPHIVRHPSRQAAAEGFGRVVAVIGQDNEAALHGPIISGLRKLGNARFDPFPVYYHRFASALLDCPRLLIIGYGGGDVHVSDLLWRWRRLHRDRARLVWVTHRCDLRESRDDLKFPVYAAGNGEYGDFRRVTEDDIARGDSRTTNAYVVFTGSPLTDSATQRAIDFLAS